VPNMSSKHCWHSANLPGFPHNQTRTCAIHARCLATCRHSAHCGLHQHPDANVCVYLSRRAHASKCGIAWILHPTSAGPWYRCDTMKAHSVSQQNAPAHARRMGLTPSPVLSSGL
jgi:hypothetical protein